MNRNSGIAYSAYYPEFDLIDMNFAIEREQCEYGEAYSAMPSVSKMGEANGRMYDPVIGRFLSPDPYVQNATNPQNFNRYSYCLNNPLKYTDPSGLKVYPGYTIFDSGLGLDKKQLGSDSGNKGGGGSGTARGYSSYGNIYNNTQDSYYITNPSIINNYYTSGMSFDDWVDEQVRMGNATHLLGGVSVVAYNQASYDRAALNIWNQVHYADNYSGGWYSPGGGNSEITTSHRYSNYKECSYSYKEAYLDYIPYNGAGFNGSTTVRGFARVYKMNGKAHAFVSADAFTPLENIGEVIYSGCVSIYVNGDKINSVGLRPATGAYISQTGRSLVGVNDFVLPQTNGDVTLMFDIRYMFSDGTGYSPSRGFEHKLQIEFAKP